MPEISVIVPVYKVEKYLERCIDSILAQTFTDFELILIDDGSPDGCPEICDHYAKTDRRIKVIHQKNSGVSVARNAGLDIMTGKYVMFVDSDDALHTEILNVLHYLSETDEADLSICGATVFDTDCLPDDIKFALPITSQIYDGKQVFNSLITIPINRAAPWGKLYRRELFDNIRFKPGITYEDLQLYPYILARAKKIVSCPLPLYYYFVLDGSGSAMRSPLSEKKFVAIDIQYDHYKFYRSNSAEKSAMISAYKLMLKFPCAATKLSNSKRLSRTFVKYYIKYLMKIIVIPTRYLSIKNKLIYLSTIIPAKKLRSLYSDMYKNEPFFDSPNNL